MTGEAPLESPRKSPLKIISGGQTGVDRGALDAARVLGLPHGGSCPRGRLAEDGRIPDEYPLVELDTPEYPARTERNVLDADATLILCRGAVTGGTALTRRLARKHQRPLLVVSLLATDDGKLEETLAGKIREWLARCRPRTLNVAGPRESHCRGIARQTYELLLRVFRPAPSDSEADR